VLVMDVAQVGAVKLGLQGWVFKSGCADRRVRVGIVNSVSLTTSR
jgi:hypothetical protein